MKKLLTILALALVACSVSAASRITATVTITNAPTTNGMTFVLNGDTRTWTNDVVTPASQILTNNTIGGVFTNLYNHITSKMFAGPVNVQTNGGVTNIIIFRAQIDQALVISFSGNYASVSYDTNPVTAGRPVIIPISGEPVASERTNIASGIILGVNTYSTNALDQTLPVSSQLVGLGNNQTITGIKTMTGANIYANASQLFSGGTVTNVNLTNIASFNGNIIGTATNTDGTITGGTLTNNTIKDAASISGTVSTLTNGGWINPKLTNGINYGNAFSSVGAGSSSEQFGSGATAAGANSTAVGRLATGPSPQAAVYGYSATVLPTATNATAIGAESYAEGNSASAFGNIADARAPAGTALGASSFVAATHTNSTAVGTGTSTTDKNQVRLGTSVVSVSIRQNASIGNNLAIGVDWETGFVDSLAKGVLITNGAAAAANPTNAIAFWSESGEWQYRTSASSEGAGQVNRVHNRGSQVNGSGSDFTIAGTAYARVDLGGQDPEVTLPTAGTYTIFAIVEVVNGGTANDVYNFKLFNSTDAGDVANSDVRLSNIAASQTHPLSWPTVVTVTASKTIQLYGQNSTAARGTITAVRTRLTYVRLY